MTFANKSEEEKIQIASDISKRLQARSQEELELADKRLHRTIANRTPEEDAEIRRKYSEGTKRYYATLPTEERKAIAQRRLKTIANKPEAERQKTSRRMARSQKRRHRLETKEERSQIGQKAAATRAAWPEERKAEYSKTLSAAIAEYWAAMSPGKRANLGRKISDAVKVWWEGLSEEEREKIIGPWREGLKKSPNNIEKALLEMIQGLGFEFVGNGKFWIGRRNPDFVNRKERIIIELFSRYWHKDKAADDARIKAYKKGGFRVLVIWDDHFYKNPAKQVRRVECLLKGA